MKRPEVDRKAQQGQVSIPLVTAPSSQVVVVTEEDMRRTPTENGYGHGV